MDNARDFYSLNVGSIPAGGASNADVMELVYILDLKLRFYGFESRHPYQIYSCSSKVEQETHNFLVTGSNPVGSTTRQTVLFLSNTVFFFALHLYLLYDIMVPIIERSLTNASR